MRTRALVISAVFLACAPLDRRDGALVIALERVPPQVDMIEVVVRADGRSFEQRVPVPSDGLITEFSAVPAGPAELDLRLFSGTELIDMRLGIAVDIVENTIVELAVNFESGPDFDIVEPRQDEPHLLRGGAFILIEIMPLNAALMLELTATANQTPVSVVFDGRSFVGTIDPALAGNVLPAPIALKVTACLVEQPTYCIERERSVVVTRASWRRTIAPETIGQPKPWGTEIVLVDQAGTLLTITSSGGDAMAPLSLSTEVKEDFALIDDTVHVAADSLRIIDLRSRTITTQDLMPTSAPAGGIVAANTDLIRIADRSVIASLPRRVRAPPLVDAEGIVAGDILGNVLALDAAGATMFLTNVGAPIFAQPVRYAGRIAIATSGGQIVQLDPDGAEPIPRLDLMRPIVHAPIVIGERLIAAADDRVVFIELDRIGDTVAVGGTITAPPVAWGDAVVVGLQNGLVRRVTTAGSEVVERVQGAALGLLVLELPPDAHTGIVVVGSAGDLALLEPEEAF